ncbi:MAG: hypothetical protein AAF412_04675, partial [Pseudomonadota bacterium]
HVAAGLRGIHKHELQFDETPLFERIVKSAKPIPRANTVRLPTCLGTGIEINRELTKTFETARFHSTNKIDSSGASKRQ